MADQGVDGIALPQRNRRGQTQRVPDELMSPRRQDSAVWLAFYLAGLVLFGLVTVLRYPRLDALRPVYDPLALVCVGGGVLLFFLAARSTVPRLLSPLLPRRRALLVAGAAATLALSCVGVADLARLPHDLAHPHRYWNDAIAFTDCSTSLFVRGHNPYTDFSLVACFARLHMDGRFTTPLRAGLFAHDVTSPPRDATVRLFALRAAQHARHPGEFEGAVSYPAGAFLLAAPFYALGWHELATFYLAWTVLAYLLLAWRASWRARLPLAPLALANVAYWDNVSHGLSESLVVSLILAAWIAYRRTWVSTTLMGLAVATRQDAWLVAPFYLVLIGRVYGWRASTRRAVVIAALFALANGPFLLQSPDAWLAGVLGPFRDPMYPLGQGVIALGLLGWLPLWPRPVYTVLEAAALGACLLIYARTCRRQPATGLVPLLFAWRSLFVYFYVPLPLYGLWALIANAGPDGFGEDKKSLPGRRSLRIGMR